MATELATASLATRVFVETALETSDLETVLSMDTKLDTGALDTATPGPSGSKLVLACALASMTSRSDTRVSALTSTLTADALTCASAFARIFSLRTASLKAADPVRTTLRTARLRT